MTQSFYCSMCDTSFGEAATGERPQKIVVGGKHCKICEDCIETCLGLIAQAKKANTLAAVNLSTIGNLS